jgi:hypothetical protein
MRKSTRLKLLAIWEDAACPPRRSKLRSLQNANDLHTFLNGAIASGDAGLVSGFFNTMGDGLGDAFVEH